MPPQPVKVPGRLRSSRHGIHGRRHVGPEPRRTGLYSSLKLIGKRWSVGQVGTRLPAGIDVDQATALTNYQLAWILLHHAARGVTPKTVVVYGAAGGVGSALIDVARLAGATVIGTAGSADKCEFVRSRGAAHAIDYSRENVVERVQAVTDGRGADIILIPEIPFDYERVANAVRRRDADSCLSTLIVVAEGAKYDAIARASRIANGTRTATDAFIRQPGVLLPKVRRARRKQRIAAMTNKAATT